MTTSTTRTPDEVTQYYETLVTLFRQKAFIQRNLDALDQHLTPDFVDHFAPPEHPPGIAGVRYRFSQAAEAFHTLQVEVLHSVSKDDILMQAIRVHLRHTGEFMGIPPTQREIVMPGFDAFQFRGEKLAAHWGVYDVSRIPDLLGAPPAVPGKDMSTTWAAMWER
ncbi:MAG TPA: ester cyclase [Terriglobales bacterium]|nr:ester cyclase [Terriglobales bacterium]